MSKLIWNDVGERFYESGVDRGVLYFPDVNGVPWNGLVSVSEKLGGESGEALYYDGVKCRHYQVMDDYAASLSAITYPDEFLPYDGLEKDSNQMGWGNQRVRNRFGLCYRSKVGNDIFDPHYKLHLLYNLTAVPSNKSYNTLQARQDPSLFSWDISGVPQYAPGYKPTAHVILDSRTMDPGKLASLEYILYGSEEANPRLPSIVELLGITLIITDHGDGTWSAEGPEGVVTVIDPDTFELSAPSVIPQDPGSYTASSA